MNLHRYLNSPHLTFILFIFLGILNLKGETSIQLTTENGLLSNYIHDIKMDNDRCMWVATRLGLSCFNGKEVTTYLPLSAHTDPKMYNDVLGIAPAADGKIYFITYQAFGCYDKKTGKFSSIELPIEPPYHYIIKLTSGNLLIGGNGLSEFDLASGQSRTLLSEKPESLSLITSILEDRLGQIWIGTQEKGVFRYSPHEKNLINYEKTQRCSPIINIYQDLSDRIYIITAKTGLIELDNPYVATQSILRTVKPQGLTDNSAVISMSEIRTDSALLLGTENGVLKMNHNGITMPLIQDRKIGKTTCLMTDSSGVVWIGTINDGLIYCDFKSPLFRHPKSERPHLPEGFSNPVSVFEDQEGTLWSGVLSYPIAWNKMESEEWDFPSTMLGREKKELPKIYSMEEDDEYRYFGSYGEGLYSLNKSTNEFTNYTTSNSIAIPNGRIMRLFIDSKDNLWIGTMQGIGVIGKNKEQKLISTQGDVMGFCEAHGKVYAATLNDGIFVVDISSLPQEESAKSDNFRIALADGFQPIILSIAASRDSNKLYIGTEDEGLWIYDVSSKEYALTDFTPLHCNLQVACLQEDAYGWLWVATNNGLYRVNISNPLDRMIFTTEDGLESDYFCYNGTSRGDNLYLLTNKGIEIIDMSMAFPQPISPNELHFGITEMLFNSRRFEELPPEDQQLIGGEILPWYDNDIEIPYDFNNITFKFAAFEYKSTPHIIFQYQLEGKDGDWHQVAEGGNAVTFSRLFPGKYTLHLKIGFANGVWSEGEIAYSFRILAPWYLSIWAIIIYVIIAAGATFLVIVKIRHRQQHDENSPIGEEGKKLYIDLNKFDIEPEEVALMRKATQAVERNIDNPDFDVDAFAKEMGLSKTNLFRKMKKCVDMSPANFIRSIRLRTAAKILVENPNVRINELAYMVGFSDSRYFSMCFKKEFGVTPGDYKNKEKPIVNQ